MMRNKSIQAMLGMGIGTVLLVSCKDDVAGPRDPGFAYFPTAIGTWVEYQVDSIWRDDEQEVHDSISYRLLERIEEHYVDPAGRPAQRVLRYVLDDHNEWVVRDVWTATLSERYAEKLEENMRRLKLSFPLRKGRTWDTNIYNTDKELPVVIKDMDVQVSLGSMALDSTLVLENTIPANLVERRDLMERYAKHIGLVEKHWTETITQPQFLPNGQIIYRVKGFWLRMTAVAHGHP